MQKWPKYCTPLCYQLRCSKKAMGKKVWINNKKYVECLFVPGEYCTGRECNYSYCLKRSFRNDGKCGQWVALQNRNRDDDKFLDDDIDDFIEEEEIPIVKKIKKKYPSVKGKALKKIKEYDDF
ncbi:MAG: hypothetical protein ACTSPY_17455 [Candidatus Helarchaeota archaeon]